MFRHFPMSVTKSGRNPMPKLYLYHSFFGWKLSELTIVNHKGSAFHMFTPQCLWLMVPFTCLYAGQNSFPSTWYWWHLLPTSRYSDSWGERNKISHQQQVILLQRIWQAWRCWCKLCDVETLLKKLSIRFWNEFRTLGRIV